MGNWYSKIPHLKNGKFERYLPTSFDSSLSLLEKINRIIEFLNHVIDVTNESIDYIDKNITKQNQEIQKLKENFEVLKKWLENEGLQEKVLNVLNDWFDSGKLAQLINDDLLNFKADKTEVDAIKKITDLLKVNIKYPSVASHVSDTELMPTESQAQHIFKQGLQIQLCPTVRVPTLTSEVLTPTNRIRIQTAIDIFKSNGVDVCMLKPHINLHETDGTDRGLYNPTNKSLFFEAWKNLLLDYAEICEINKIPILCISCEMRILTENQYYQSWSNIYYALKDAFPNLLITHAPKTSEFNVNYETWEYSDILGFNFYSSYTDETFNDYSVIPDDKIEFFKEMCGVRLNSFDYVFTKYKNKPLFITEIGCMPYPDGLIDVLSIDYQNNVTRNNHVQVALLKVIFEYICMLPNYIGFTWWSIEPPFDYFNNIETTPQEKIIIEYIKGGKLK